MVLLGNKFGSTQFAAMGTKLSAGGVKLELADNQLTSLIPSEIGELSVLASLTLNANELWWTLPTEIGLLSNALQILHLSDNNLAGSMPKEVGGLEQIQEFHLHGNPYLFGGIPAAELASLPNLREMTLNGTSVTGNLPDALCEIDLLAVDCAADGNSRSGLCGCECECDAYKQT